MYFILILRTCFVKIFYVNLPLSSLLPKPFLNFHQKYTKKEASFLKPLFVTVPSQFYILYIWLTNVSITFSAAPNAAAATL